MCFCDCVYSEQWRTPGSGCSCWAAAASSGSVGGRIPADGPRPPPPCWTTGRAASAPSGWAAPGLQTAGHMTAAGGSSCSFFWGALTQSLQVRTRERAQVQVQALQVCHMSQVEGEVAQSSGQVFIAGQVQLSQGGEAAQGGAWPRKQQAPQHVRVRRCMEESCWVIQDKLLVLPSSNYYFIIKPSCCNILQKLFWNLWCFSPMHTLRSRMLYFLDTFMAKSISSTSSFKHLHICSSFCGL